MTILDSVKYMAALKKAGAIVRHTVQRQSPVLEADASGWLTDLDQEAGEAEWIAVQHDAANIADDLGQAPEEHGSHESPRLPFEPEDNLYDSYDGVNDDEGDRGAECWLVGVDTVFDRASV